VPVVRHSPTSGVSGSSAGLGRCASGPIGFVICMIIAVARCGVRMQRAIVAVGMMLTLLGGCGGDDDSDEGQSVTTTVVTQETSTTEPTGEPTDFQATTFTPAFSARLPAGWIVAERGADLAQAYEECTSCVHGGEENGEITIGRDFSSLPPAEAAAHVVAAQNGTAGPIEPAEVGPYTGTHVAITRPGTTQLRFTDNGYHTEATGDPVDLYFVDVDGQTVSILVDAHEASGAVSTAFHDAVAEVLASLTFES